MAEILVTGAGGFIGHHLVKYLVQCGNRVRGVDLRRPGFEESAAHEFLLLDLRDPENCLEATRGIRHVYHLAADMGGIGYISHHHAEIARNNTLIDLRMLEGARANSVRRFLFSSSACVYPQALQSEADVRGLREIDAWPADPEPGYGLEKLFAEKMCEYYWQDFGMETRVVRFHNVYGPLGAFDGGREKAPAAVCRKVALAADGSEIEVWGDGEQTRSFMYIDDCVEGIYRIMRSDCAHPLNLGRTELVTINQMFDIVAEIAGKRIRKRYNYSKPQGVRGRNSDNELLRRVLGWQPGISLRTGLESTYRWIDSRILGTERAAGAG
jgi:nucleoside-diphosphate-sugar epimerase